MRNDIQPPVAQPLERRLWFELEPRYWLYLAGAVLTCLLELLLGPGAWWQKALCCGLLLLLAALPAARWGGVHLDSRLWWEARHILQALAAALAQGSARLLCLLRQQSSAGRARASTSTAAAETASAAALPAAPPRQWWQERAWDALDRAPAGTAPAAAAWDSAGERSAEDEEDAAEEGWREAQWQNAMHPAGEEDASAAGWMDDWVGPSGAEEAEEWVDDWASQTPAHPSPGHPGEHARLTLLRTPTHHCALGLAWDATTAGAYDPLALFLLDQPPRFQPQIPSAAKKKGA